MYLNMRLQAIAHSATFLICAATAYHPASTTETDHLAGKGLINLGINQVSLAQSGKLGTCHLGNVAVRKEWSNLTNSERTAYSNAVLCMMNKPARTDSAAVPGAKTRYDDFVFTHINQTLTIHGTGNFLSWHRYYTWSFEQALKAECGYKGTQPYWNWGKSAFDPVNSPYFDGSAYSMGGNGVYEAHNCTNGLPTGLNCIPAGNGGGCVETGPFKNMSVNLGPVTPTLAEPEVIVPDGFGTAYNPRCLKRDITPWVSSQWNRDNDSATLITSNPDIYWFQTNMQGDFAAGDYGVHTGGHFTYGGDPGGDLFVSPGDPMFWLHHAQIDRTWWIWQNQDLKNRQNAVSGTITLNNTPPSRNTTLDDVIDMGVSWNSTTVGRVMNTMDGPLCYIYI